MTNTAILPNQRRYDRLNIDLPVRFFHRVGEPSKARLLNISMGGAAILGGQRPRIGSRITTYVEHLDRFQGKVVRLFGRGFGVEFSMSDRKRDRLADKLTLLANKDALGLALDRRKYLRQAAPGESVICKFENGEASKCNLIDCSIIGASLESSERPFIGTRVKVGQTKGYVVRHTTNGFAVEFEEFWKHREQNGVYAVH